MVVDRELEALSGLEVVGVVEGLRIQQHAQSVGLAHLTSGACGGEFVNTELIKFAGVNLIDMHENPLIRLTARATKFASN